MKEIIRFKKRQMMEMDFLSIEDIKLVSSYVLNISIREMQNKCATMYYLMFVVLANIETTKNNK
jgi:hypothetical protein